MRFFAPQGQPLWIGGLEGCHAQRPGGVSSKGCGSDANPRGCGPAIGGKFAGNAAEPAHHTWGDGTGGPPEVARSLETPIALQQGSPSVIRCFRSRGDDSTLFPGPDSDFAPQLSIFAAIHHRGFRC